MQCHVLAPVRHMFICRIVKASACIVAFLVANTPRKREVHILTLCFGKLNRKYTFLPGTAPIHALYLGGGTPTALTAQELSRLLVSLRQNLPLANDCEITVEGRIHNFGEDKMELSENKNCVLVRSLSVNQKF